MKNKDRVFADPRDEIGEFVFDQGVADVFDDMVSRSVPFYDEIHRIQTDLAKKFLSSGERVLDLGCSTGTTIGLLHRHLEKEKIKASFWGVDNSAPMIEKAKNKLEKVENLDVDLKVGDLTQMDFPAAKMIVMNYTLQFIDKNHRIALLEKIYRALLPGGIFILAEKIKCDDEKLDDLFIELYYDFKRRNGYSELEISQKREALENVLIPLRPTEQLSLLKIAGFKQTDLLFRWYNFATFVGLKEEK